MALPEQIRKQSEAVKELYEQVNADDETGTDADGHDEPTGDVQGRDVADVDVNDEAIPPSEPEPKKREKAKDDEETLQQKYRTLQGMYNAEVPKLHAENKDLNMRLQQMEQLLSTLSDQSKQNSTSQPAQHEPLVSEEDINEYGESIDVMRKVSREEYMPVVQKISELEKYLQDLQNNVVPQVNSLSQHQRASTEQQFWSQLGSAVPNWREVNDNADFQTWLLQQDPLVGVSRQTMLEDAQRNYDVNRVIQFFKTWLDMSGSSEATASQNSQRTSELEKQVAPGRARNASSSTATNQKTYTPEDIKKFFNDVQRGKYKGREQERARIERDIFAAQKDGRIVVNG